MTEQALMTQERLLPLEPGLGFEPRYDLTQEEVDAVAERLIKERGGVIGSQFVCYELHPCDSDTNAARTLERRVFEEAFNNDVAKMKYEYDDFEHGSRFFVIVDQAAVDENGKPAPKLIGSIRATQSAKDLTQLKTLHDISKRTLLREKLPEPLPGEEISPENIVPNIPLSEVVERYGITPDNTWDVGTLAVLKEYRGLESNFIPSTMLYRAMFMAARRHGIDNIVAIFDKAPLKQLATMGVEMPPICDMPPVSYAGSESSVFVRLDATTALELCEAQRQRYLESTSRLAPYLAELAGRLSQGIDVDEFTRPLSSAINATVVLEQVA